MDRIRSSQATSSVFDIFCNRSNKEVKAFLGIPFVRYDFQINLDKI